MAVKYRINYKRLSQGITTIDIEDATYSGDVIYLTSTGDPLNISFNGDVNNIYAPTTGSGATIKVISTPLTLTGLFTIDPQKYVVKIYNGVSGVNLVWQGFINTGLYSESYSVGYNVPSQITIECNDGMALLDEYYYKQSDGTLYTGFETIGQVLNNIQSKLIIAFYNIYTNNDLNTKTSDYNLFAELKVNNENYVDENLTAMSCREVLNSIFGALGLSMSFRGTNIYIIDPINLHNTAKGKVYDTAMFTENVLTLGGYLDISNKDINWFETGSNLDIIPSFNQIKVNYDPYSFTGYTYGFTTENASYGPSIPYTNNSITYNIFSPVTMKDWTLTYPASFEGIQANDSFVKLDDPTFYIKQVPGASGSFSYTFPQSNIKQDDNLQLQLNMDVYVNTKNDSNILTPGEREIFINTLYLKGIEIKIGDKWWNGSGWQDTTASSNIYVREIDANYELVWVTNDMSWVRKKAYLKNVDLSRIDDRWTTVMIYIPISDAVVSGTGLLSGSIFINIPADAAFGAIVPPLIRQELGDDWISNSTEAYIKNIIIKNISLQIVDSNKIQISNTGILRTADINSIVNMKKKPTDIKLTNGTGPYGVSRGAFSGLDETVSGTNIVGLYRGTDVTIHNTIDLLSQSLLSQYKVPRSKLTGTLNVKDFLLGVTTKLIKDSTYSYDENDNPKAFYIAGGTYNDRYENMNCVMIECASTREFLS